VKDLPGAEKRPVHAGKSVPDEHPSERLHDPGCDCHAVFSPRVLTDLVLLRRRYCPQDRVQPTIKVFTCGRMDSRPPTPKAAVADGPSKVFFM
jgi:hypothetical protein